MDGRRDDSAQHDPSRDGSAPDAPAAPLAPSAPRGRHGVSAQAAATSWLREPGISLVLGSLALAVVAALAIAVGWVALLLLVGFVQVLFSRAWTDYLELPGAVASAFGIVVVAAAADTGVVVSRLVDDSDVRSNELLQVAPALGVVFLVAVVVQLLRRDGRAGVLGGLVATTTGGVLVIGMALWLPLEASPAGARWVAVGFAAVAVIGVVVGGTGWMRQSRVPAAAVLLPLLLALLAGPFYVLGRVVAG